MSDEELTEEERKALEEEKAKSWLFGQEWSRRRFDPEAYKRAKEMREQEEREERELENEEEAEES